MMKYAILVIHLLSLSVFAAEETKEFESKGLKTLVEKLDLLKKLYFESKSNDLSATFKTTSPEVGVVEQECKIRPTTSVSNEVITMMDLRI